MKQPETMVFPQVKEIGISIANAGGAMVEIEFEINSLGPSTANNF